MHEDTISAISLLIRDKSCVGYTASVPGSRHYVNGNLICNLIANVPDIEKKR